MWRGASGPKYIRCGLVREGPPSHLSHQVDDFFSPSRQSANVDSVFFCRVSLSLFVWMTAALLGDGVKKEHQTDILKTNSLTQFTLRMNQINPWLH